jgi:predicted nucleotidyltransferase
MTSNVKLNIITEKITQGVRELLGDKLHRIILYGSYARGDYDEESDIDIMVLADILDEDWYLFERGINGIINPIELDYNILISVYIKNRHSFEELTPILPFYRNVVTEGVELYAQ